MPYWQDFQKNQTVKKKKKKKKNMPFIYMQTISYLKHKRPKSAMDIRYNLWISGL